MKDAYTKFKSVAQHTHGAHNICHCVYFGLVAVESEHWYALAAAILLAITILQMVGGNNEG
jgi:hypothetical protein